MSAFNLGVGGSIAVFGEAENGVVILCLVEVSKGSDGRWKGLRSAIAGSSKISPCLLGPQG